MALQNVEANITLDLYNHDTTPATVKAIQLDSQTRYVAAMLQSMGAEYGLDSNATVQLIVIRPDKVGVQITGTTFTYGDEGAQFLGPYAELTQVALAVNGKMRGQFKITSGDQILRTEIFAISNGEALDASTDEWADEYDGYNLEEMATSIETNTSDIASLEADVSQIKEDLQDLINSAYVTDSASGSIAHFVDGADDVPVKSLKVNIEPVQSGSGDPSPDNVRPISGWNSVKVMRAGKNLLAYPYSTQDSITRNGITFDVHKTSDGRVDYVSASGTATGLAFFNFNTWGEKRTNAKLLVGKTLKLTGCPKLGNDNKVDLTFQYRRFGSQQNIGLAHDFGEGSNEFSVPSDMDSWTIYIQIAEGTQVSDARFYPMLRLASDTDDNYEPYNGNTYDISLSSAGTVYGGTLDAVSGELKVTHGYIASYSGQELPSAWISDRDVYAEGTRPTTGAQVVYQLATPLIYQLSATEIKSFLGINNIWSDAGDMDVEYRADTKLYIDKRLGV